MLAQLIDAHAGVLAAVASLEALTTPAPPDKAEVAMARWKLTQASRQTRRLLDLIVYPEAERAAGGRSSGLAALRAADAALVLQSAQHIAIWDIDTVLADWPGYRSAAAIVCDTVRERVLAERAVLNPLLAGETR